MRQFWNRITGKTRRELEHLIDSVNETIAEKERHIFELENAIANDDIDFLTHIKIKVNMFRDIERAVWAGSHTLINEVEIKELSPSPFKGGKVVYDYDKNEGYYVTFDEDE